MFVKTAYRNCNACNYPCIPDCLALTSECCCSSFCGENKTFFSGSEYWFTYHDVLGLCLTSLPTGHGQRQVTLPSYPQLMSIMYSRSTGVFLCGCSSVSHWLKIPSQFLCGDQLISQSMSFDSNCSWKSIAQPMKIQRSQLFRQFFSIDSVPALSL